MEYLYEAGYDPQAFISFFERIQALEKQKPGAISKMFSSHPQTADRIRKTQSEIVKILPPREAYVISTSDFDEMKLRLAAIENRRQTRGQEPDRPTLRRRPSGDQGDPEGNDRAPNTESEEVTESGGALGSPCTGRRVAVIEELSEFTVLCQIDPPMLTMDSHGLRHVLAFALDVYPPVAGVPAHYRLRRSLRRLRFQSSR